MWSPRQEDVVSLAVSHTVWLEWWEWESVCKYERTPPQRRAFRHAIPVHIYRAHSVPGLAPGANELVVDAYTAKAHSWEIKLLLTDSLPSEPDRSPRAQAGSCEATMTL